MSIAPNPLSERLAAHAEWGYVGNGELRADLLKAAYALREINVVCGLAGIGERDQMTLDRVRSLAAELGAALGREEALRNEVEKLNTLIRAQ